MDRNNERFCTPAMGISDTSKVDGLCFDDLERALSLILEENPLPLIHIPQPSISNYTPPHIQEKISYFHRVSQDVMESRNKFLELYENVNKEIDDMVERLTSCIKKREKELKSQLRHIAHSKITTWDQQISTCKDAINKLQVNGVYGLQNFDFAVFDKIVENSKLSECCEMKFVTDNFLQILNSLQNFGKVGRVQDLKWSFPVNDNIKNVPPKFIFGSSGEAPGQFSRPWGVCSDSMGRILVCDRSNNRVQIFNEFGGFLFEIGNEGSGLGEFNRPSGIDTDKNNRIIVADKDNHRIQVFSYCGHFLFSFGKQGELNGEFMYPWDVAVNSKCEIAVSDSKNHRVQLFNKNGQFITFFSAKKARVYNPRYSLKVLDSPRGLAFRPDGTLLVTDFNNHKILVINQNFNKVFNFGCEGINPGQFYRPQGIACDRYGNFVVADSKNYRVQLFDDTGKLVKTFGTKGAEPGEFDCPQGVCFLNNSRHICVVDFSNNRVQVF